MTAVEWLWKVLLDNGFQELENVEGFYYQAKEMEKQQIIDAYAIGAINGEMIERDLKPKYTNPIQYYNETFKNNEL